MVVQETNKNKFWLWGFCSIAGFAISWFSKDNLINRTENFGPFAIGLFVPLSFSVLFLVIACLYDSSKNNQTAILSILIFLITSLPFAAHLPDAIYFLEKDDGYRYSITAHNMVTNKTLWGGDGLVTQWKGSLAYVFNPGYRYFLALELLIFGKETRGWQLFNQLLWLLLLIPWVKFGFSGLKNLLQKKIFALFTLGSSIYAAKNIMLNLSEWFFVLLLILFFITVSTKKNLAYIFLGFAVLVRQNQVFAAFLLVFLTLRNRNFTGLLVFFLILCLPVIHNLYFAGKLQWLPHYPFPLDYFFIEDSSGNTLFDFMIALYRTGIRYMLGIDLRHSLQQNLFGLMLIPAGILLLIQFFKTTGSHQRKLFLLQVAFTIGPSLILNWAYFPRFEFANIYMLLITAMLVLQYPNRTGLHFLQKLQ